MRRSINPFRRERRYRVIATKPGVYVENFFWFRRHASDWACKRIGVYAKMEITDTWNHEELFVFYG